MDEVAANADLYIVGMQSIDIFAFLTDEVARCCIIGVMLRANDSKSWSSGRS